MSPLSRIQWIDLPSVSDPRGVLTAIESGQDIPFEIRRIFYVHRVQEDRGGHAHPDTEQVLIPISGSLTAAFFDGEETRSYTLDDPLKGLYMPPMLFVDLLDFSPGAVCLVLASSHYDIQRSLRSREAFLAALAAEGAGGAEGD